MNTAVTIRLAADDRGLLDLLDEAQEKQQQLKAELSDCRIERRILIFAFLAVAWYDLARLASWLIKVIVRYFA